MAATGSSCRTCPAVVRCASRPVANVALATRPRMDEVPILLLPGMAADERLFEPQRRCFPGLRVPRWIDLRALGHVRRGALAAQPGGAAVAGVPEPRRGRCDTAGRAHAARHDRPRRRARALRVQPGEGRRYFSSLM